MPFKRTTRNQCRCCPWGDRTHHTCWTCKTILGVPVGERCQVYCGSTVRDLRCDASWKWLQHWMPYRSNDSWRYIASSHEPGWPGWPGYRDEFFVGFIWEISARFTRWEKAKDPLGPNSRNKANMAKYKILTFRPIIASVTLKAVSLQLNGMLMMWKIQQAMQDDAIRTARIHPAVHPGNRDEVFIWQNFQPAYRDLGWKNRDLGNRASPPSHMNISKILQRI